jgi:molecular chaperone DnaK
VFQAEKMLKENGDKAPADLKAEIESAVSEAKSKLDSGDYDTLVKARENLETRVHKLAELIYKSAGATAGDAGQAAGAPGTGPTTSDKGNVVDAEYEDGGTR